MAGRVLGSAPLLGLEICSLVLIIFGLLGSQPMGCLGGLTSCCPPHRVLLARACPVLWCQGHKHGAMLPGMARHETELVTCMGCTLLQVLRDCKHFWKEYPGDRPLDGPQPPPGSLRLWCRVQLPQHLALQQAQPRWAGGRPGGMVRRHWGVGVERTSCKLARWFHVCSP